MAISLGKACDSSRRELISASCRTISTEANIYQPESVGHPSRDVFNVFVVVRDIVVLLCISIL